MENEFILCRCPKCSDKKENIGIMKGGKNIGEFKHYSDVYCICGKKIDGYYSSAESLKLCEECIMNDKKAVEVVEK